MGSGRRGIVTWHPLVANPPSRVRTTSRGSCRTESVLRPRMKNSASQTRRSPRYWTRGQMLAIRRQVRPTQRHDGDGPPAHTRSSIHRLFPRSTRRRHIVCFDEHLWRKNMGECRGQIYVRGSEEMMAKRPSPDSLEQSVPARVGAAPTWHLRYQ